MARRPQQRARAGVHIRSSDVSSFRKLVEQKISADDYVRRLEERVQQRAVHEERPLTATPPQAAET